MNKEKIARICWNTNGWLKPSGMAGKSKNKYAYEYRVGFGHEEWLLDTTKNYKGYHYAYLQPIGLHREKYRGQTFNISLYSINEETKKRWWLGGIRNVTVTTKEESQEAFLAYKKNGWLTEMEEQIRSVGGKVQELGKTKLEDFFVIRFRPRSLDLLDTPLEFSRRDPAVKATYYVLLNKDKMPKLLSPKKQFSFRHGHTKKKGTTESSYEAHSSNIDLVHNRIQTKIYQQLAKKFGKENIGTEVDAGYGSLIDVVIKEANDKYIFYEIKTSYSVRLSIREALAQLLEYAYYPNRNNAIKIVVVSPNAITKEAQSYLEHLRNRFGIPVYYQRYDPEQEELEDKIY
ncbi:MAG: hypothetical protein COZ31_08540 [Nitrospirae bacterium CG_4_10_14_3_um_filter_44_29]|nr:hypothetical protein [Nitrospirota bacterium]OIO29040.1 MAG: hypothetical protein AUJ60_06055 [Nitrospirae bacterium CG1_02_44_142]PIP69664.1 MAG: hypothetical protein COW90_09415 [Nitrospirae bacterium CG22_combo_CG10-13_8_21_14_all_44_11]PIV40110.1 MAG: hypothetical protein COS28_10600 [Nitrospirae bacterium CG02_land_8_20_14_3_00_44_33]PIV67563.1 MAG: hypothetical protein COS10_00415 [Nitrospirae bacterium CG01_land_8_20_14_3_00_44_22]PIW90643.1 MAG: hypothetical protein COZ93_00900 [Nit